MFSYKINILKFVVAYVSIGKNAFHMVFAQYLETEIFNLRLVLSRWVIIIKRC